MNRILCAITIAATIVSPIQTTEAAGPASAKPLRLLGVRAEPQSPRAGELLTLHIAMEGTWATPYYQEEIALDAAVSLEGKPEWTVPGFYTQNYHRTNVGSADNPSESLTPVGDPEWQIRFLPNAPGTYRFRLSATDRTGTVEHELTVNVQPGTSRSFVRVSPRDANYFEFDDGTPYFANGACICWYREDKGTFDYDHWFSDLADNGGNFARIWLSSWGFQFDWGTVGDYRLDRAWQIDYIVRLALEKGIYLKLCMDCQHDFNNPGHPYLEAQGGPAVDHRDFFVNDEAKRLFKNRLRYAVARWGWSPSVMAWELWNEIEDVKDYIAKNVIPWTGEMAAYLKDIDPNHHMTVNSFGAYMFDPNMWLLPEMDFAQMHGYRRPGWYSDEFGRDMAASMQFHMQMLAPFKKPRLFAEFGLVDENWGFSPLMDTADTTGVNMHNGMWGAMMSGAAGTAHLWWWDAYIDRRGLWSEYRPVANFIAGVDFPGEGFEAFEMHAGAPEDVRVLGLRGQSTTLLWAQNRAHTWWNVAEGNPVEPVTDASITLPWPEKTARCQVEILDTYTGAVTDIRMLTPQNGALVIDLGTVTKDVAVRVRGQ